MRFVFEVAAKIETLRMDGEKQFTVQGRLSVTHEGQDLQGEPLNMGLVLPFETWDRLSVGDLMFFDYAVQ